MSLSSFQQRTLSTLVLGPLLLWAVVALKGESFSLLLALMLALAAWEWGQLSGQAARLPRAGYALVLVALFYLSRWVPISVLLGIALLWWVGALFWLSGYPERNKWLFSRVFSPVAGVIVLIPAWRSLELVHQQAEGVGLLFLLLLLIWGADIGAYLVGVRFGRNKLAPKVSPGKSVEGVLGGMVTSVLTLFLVSVWVTLPVVPLPVLIAAVVMVVIFSITGDLVESAYKRHAGVKDSGQLIPGHGGILDRVDSLTAAAPLYLLLLILSGGAVVA